MTFDFPILKVKFRDAFYISLENNLSYYDASYLEASKSNKIKLLYSIKNLVN